LERAQYRRDLRRIDACGDARVRVVHQKPVVVPQAREHLHFDLAHSAVSRFRILGAVRPTGGAASPDRYRARGPFSRAPRAYRTMRLFPRAYATAMPLITLPDGSTKAFDEPVDGLALARSIGARLEKDAVAMRVDGELKDLTAKIDRDARVEIVTRHSADGLELLRHDAAHVMAEAVKELYPETQVTIGPAIEDGFYYDFARDVPFTPEDLERIEERMREIVQRDEPIVREVWDRDRAVEFFRGIGEHYKAEIIAGIPSNEPISLYREGDFIDLCRGPHVPSTGKLKVFKLMKVAGAYWRGDSNNEMLQRIYGTAWASKDEQAQYLNMLEEAENRDHRKLGRELDLFHFQEEAPGLIFWHPKGWTIWQQVEQYMRRVYEDSGYQEVKA